MSSSESAFVLTAAKIQTMVPSEVPVDWIVVEGERLAGSGPGDPPGGMKRIHLDGVLVPGFIDSHVHLTTTGLYQDGLDLRESRSVEELLSALAAHLSGTGDDWVIGGNFDPGRNEDARMPVRHEIDRVVGEKKALLSRADGHSCAVSSSGLKAIALQPGLAGIDLDDEGSPTGVLRNQANYEARRRFFGMLPESKILSAQSGACRLALTKGVTSVHEMAGGSYMGDKDFEVMLSSLGDFPIHVVCYLATLDIQQVLGPGLRCVGGDLFLDGSIGSRTAAMSEPYLDFETRGHLYHEDDEMIDWYVEASRAGLQTGVHAIGDAAIEQALRCMEEAMIRLGPEGALGFTRLRHRIEHFECASRDHMFRAKEMGVVGSVQPAFDAYWGGESGMYAARLGERWRSMNDFSLMHREGMVLAGGSDSTVTPLDPLIGISAAVNHLSGSSAVTPAEALAMFTSSGAWAAREESERGSLGVGKRADLTVLSGDPLQTDPSEIQRLAHVETWVGGKRRWTAEEGFFLTDLENGLHKGG